MRARLSQAFCAYLLALLPLCGSAAAHEGHDHDKAPPLNLPVAPRVVAVTPDLELVGVLSGKERLTIFLHDFATNEPIKSARLFVSVDADEATATPKGDGVFEVEAPWLANAGKTDIIFRLALSEGEQDLLTGRLERPAAKEPIAKAAGLMERTAERIEQQPYIFIFALGGLVAGILLTLLISSAVARRRARDTTQPATLQAGSSESAHERPSETIKQLRRVAGAVIMLLAACAWDAEVYAAEGTTAELPSIPSTMATDMPQRMADGTLFVPKATQHLLSFRTILTAETTAPRADELIGTIVAGPNNFGRVQPERPGRIEAPDSGLAYLGKRVEKGDFLGYLVPYIEAADRATIESQIAETEARIAKQRTIHSRYMSRPGSVPRVKLDEVAGEIEALRQRLAELRPILSQRLEIRAPIGGVISMSNITVGQVVQAGKTLFEIVDPSEFWVEAIAHRETATDSISRAYAVTQQGKKLPLEYVGRGLSLRQQATPMTFRLQESSAALGIGMPVKVILQSHVQMDGFVLPSSSIVRGQAGLPIVWIKTEAERFEPQVVRHDPLDGERVVVRAGLRPDQRVVTEGVTLLNQIR